MDKVREFPNWFLDLQNEKLKEEVNLPLSSSYGKGVDSSFNFEPDFSVQKIDYTVENIDKELELYTLLEAVETGGIDVLVENIVKSPLSHFSKIKFDARQFSGIKSGLVIYAQPNIDDAGNLLSHEIRLDSILSNYNYADLIVIIVKTGAKCNVSHSYKGGNTNNIVGRKVLVVCEDSSHVNFEQAIKEAVSTISENFMFLVGPDSSARVVSKVDSKISLRQNFVFELVGVGANSSFEGTYEATDHTKYDIGVLVNIKNESCHGTITTGGIAREDSEIIYRSGISSAHEINSDIDESKLLIVGEGAKVISMPIKEANNIRQSVVSYVDTATKEEIEVFLNRIK